MDHIFNDLKDLPDTVCQMVRWNFIFASLPFGLFPLSKLNSDEGNLHKLSKF